MNTSNTQKWTTEEDLIIANTKINYSAISDFLPHRSLKSIYARASRLGYKRDVKVIQKINSENNKKNAWTTALQNKELHDIIDGELLADGCVYRKKVKNRKCYDYTFIGGSICKEYAEYVHHKIASILDSKAKIKKLHPDDINQHKKEGEFKSAHMFYSYRFTSVVFKFFYDRWYSYGPKKISIPPDLELNNVKCLHWHLGDGSIYGKTITLHTDNFKKKHVSNLLKLLSKAANADGYLRLDKKIYPTIRLNTKSAKKFLDFIGPSPIPTMAYKWGDYRA